MSGSDLVLTWDAGFGRANILRNTFWQRATNDTTTTFTGAANDNATYIIRLRPDGVLTDITCQ